MYHLTQQQTSLHTSYTIFTYTAIKSAESYTLSVPSLRQKKISLQNKSSTDTNMYFFYTHAQHRHAVVLAYGKKFSKFVYKNYGKEHKHKKMTFLVVLFALFNTLSVYYIT